MGNTPKYRIPYPDPASKAYLLPGFMKSLSEGVEAALTAAGVPAATNGDRITAPSVAARNAYFGTPTTTATQLALQARAATCDRTDTGWTERYYAARSATNPGGTRTPGWYPIAGRQPHFSAPGGAPQPIPTSSMTTITTGLGAPTDNDGFTSWTNGELVVAQAGLYALSGSFGYSGGSSSTGYRIFWLAAAALTIPNGLVDYYTRTETAASVAGQTNIITARNVYLAAGARLRMMAFHNQGADVNSVPQSTFLSATYLQPA